MYFTKNDIKQLLDVLKLNSKKDTEFTVANDLEGDEDIALIQKGENKISTLNHLSSFVLKDITYDLNAEKTARENADEIHDESLKTLNSSVNTIIEDIDNINTSITNQGKEITELQTELDEQVGQILTISTNLINVNASITTLQERATLHDDTLTTHMKQIADLQKSVENILFVNIKQNNTITSQDNRITETEHHIRLLYSDFELMAKVIQDFRTRIEALEKGGGSSSADVEDGTLSASASVANGVMSVQGSVEDGILKL